ncbi:MAG: hypothetical protein ACFFD6_07870, partial [Candidatus Thorarchaeota archaeon]
MHPISNDEHPDLPNPEICRIGAIWLSKCTGCMKCRGICLEQAITVNPGNTLYKTQTGHRFLCLVLLLR